MDTEQSSNDGVSGNVFAQVQRSTVGDAHSFDGDKAYNLFMGRNYQDRAYHKQKEEAVDVTANSTREANLAFT